MRRVVKPPFEAAAIGRFCDIPVGADGCAGTGAGGAGVGAGAGAAGAGAAVPELALALERVPELALALALERVPELAPTQQGRVQEPGLCRWRQNPQAWRRSRRLFQNNLRAQNKPVQRTTSGPVDTCVESPHVKPRSSDVSDANPIRPAFLADVERPAEPERILRPASGSPAFSGTTSMSRDRWLCVPASRRVCQHRGGLNH